jgi:hypothetical protein
VSFLRGDWTVGAVIFSTEEYISPSGQSGDDCWIIYREPRTLLK